MNGMSANTSSVGSLGSQFHNHSVMGTVAIAVIIRIALILIGEKVDANATNLKYTDIDYDVFTDASRSISDGNSPYARYSYRYPPLLAYLLLPNIYYPMFGKILFSLADVGIIWQHYSIAKGLSSRSAQVVWVALLWTVNILFAVISTRGNSDSIHNFLVLVVMNLIFLGKYEYAGAIFGLATHLRIYPIIFMPAFLLYISTPDAKNAHILRVEQKVPAKPSPFARYFSNIHALHVGSKWLCSYFNIKTNLLVVEYSLENIEFLTRFWWSSVASFALFSFSAVITYEGEFVENAILYHFKRVDARHNFSPHFYWLYLADLATTSEPIGHNVLIIAPQLLSFLNFIPQAVLFVLVTFSFARRNLCICCLLLAFILVAFNKVCTAQYFTWFACFMPVVARCTGERITLKGCVWLSTLWIMSLLFWLKCAHSLEYGGMNLFLWIWFGSLIFHVLNAMCIKFLILHLKKSLIHRGGYHHPKIQCLAPLSSTSL